MTCHALFANVPTHKRCGSTFKQAVVAAIRAIRCCPEALIHVVPCSELVFSAASCTVSLFICPPPASVPCSPDFNKTF
ncbi:unnamed protein product [Protopolystoma xenopodis]|uniref:Uncharacterized protein n=1 Tax=Protopolystoma xenopodis TaxID=117903 RepID=A0A3S5AQ68_9PLAT|nr:unnamed protein product [Protopolystoma xenopodis]